MSDEADRFEVDHVDGGIVLRLPVRLSGTRERDLGGAADEVFEHAEEKLILSFSRTTFIDSAGIGLLIELVQRARARSIDLRACDVSGQPRIVLERVQFFHYVPRFDGLEEALGDRAR